MDYHSDYSKQQTCPKHNQPIVLVNQDGLFCVACLQQLPGNISIEQFNQQQKEIYDNIIKQIDLDHQSFQSLSDQLLQFENVIIQCLDKINQIILDQINSNKEQKQKLESQIKTNQDQKSMLNVLQLASDKQQQYNKDAKDQIRKLLQSFQQKYAEIDKLFSFLEDKQIEAKQQVGELRSSLILIPEVQTKNIQQFQEFQYDIIQDSTMKYDENVYTFAFNNQNTILVIGLYKKIIVYEFMNGRISNELQRLHEPTHYVNCLHFMKQSNCFVSGGYDKQIIFWILDKNNKWVVQQILQENKIHVDFILMNKMENQLITGSHNCALEFWKKESGNWTCSQNISTKNQIQNVSLNEMEDKLIVCEKKDLIFGIQISFIQVLKYQNNQLWSVVQTFNNLRYGWNLTFTIGDQFVFATVHSDYLQVYDYDTDKGQFQVVSEIKIQNIDYCSCYFPCQFIKQQNILIYHHGQFLNIIKVNDKKNYELMQVIKFDEQSTIGTITRDGQYLATWSKQSKEFQIRKIKQQE